MYSAISYRMNQLHNVTNVSCSHHSLFQVRKPPIYLSCATNVSSKFSTRLGSHFLRSTLVGFITISFLPSFLSAKNNKFFYACVCLFASQSTGVPSYPSNVHRSTLRIPYFPIQSLRYFLFKQNIIYFLP